MNLIGPVILRFWENSEKNSEKILGIENSGAGNIMENSEKEQFLEQFLEPSGTFYDGEIPEHSGTFLEHSWDSHRFEYSVHMYVDSNIRAHGCQFEWLRACEPSIFDTRVT